MHPRLLKQTAHDAPPLSVGHQPLEIFDLLLALERLPCLGLLLFAFVNGFDWISHGRRAAS
jgi:hypothetical protein